MTLHEAIVQILKAENKNMTTQQIADGLNRNKAYHKKDGSSIKSNQISARVRKYPNLFDRDGSLVSMKGKLEVFQKVAIRLDQKVSEKPTKVSNIVYDKIEKELMEESNFRSAKVVDSIVPIESGIYCFRINDSSALPRLFEKELKNRIHNIIYIGIATKSLRKRMLNQELRAKGHGTFFRSIGAVLGFRPTKNSLTRKKNKRNYKFSEKDEAKIIDWINNNILVNWLKLDSGFENIETTLLQNHHPLLNISKNPNAMPELSGLRKECVEIANGKV